MAVARASAHIMEDKQMRDEAFDDNAPDAFLAAAATHGLAIVTRNTGEFYNISVETVDPWTAEPK